MAATVLPVTQIINAGAVMGLASGETPGDSVNGMVLAANNGTTTFITVTNTAATARTVTAVTPFTVAGLAIADQTYSIPATVGYRIAIGPFDPSVYGTTVNLTFSGAGLTVAAYQI
jgi:hypothetical protein